MNEDAIRREIARLERELDDRCHGRNNDTKRQLSTGAVPAKLRPVSPRVRHVSESRLEGRIRASRMLSVAVCSSSIAESARALDVSSQQISRWTDDAHAASIAFGDLFALPRSVQLAIAHMWMLEITSDVPRAHAPVSAHIVDLVQALGEFAGASRNGAASPALRRLLDAATRALVDL